jgi:hypothetical protein
MNTYPECERMQIVAPESRAIGEFIDWLNYEKHIILATRSDEEDTGDIQMVHYSMEKLLAEYYDIDLNKVEKERQQMLEEIRQK